MNKSRYLGDMISAGGGVEESIVARIRCGWKNFRELKPVLMCFHYAQKVKYSSNVSEVLFSVVVRPG